MCQSIPHLLTYLAQVRQLPFKNVWLCPRAARITPRILHIQPYKKYGQSRKVIVTIGIVRAVVWDEQNRNMGAWLQAVGHWLNPMIYSLSPSHAGERK